MSSYDFTAIYKQRPVRVLAGWDHVLNYPFLVVEWADDLDSDDEEGAEYAYSNLDEPNFKSLEIDFFKKKLTGMRIKAPEGFWEQIERDKKASEITPKQITKPATWFPQ